MELRDVLNNVRKMQAELNELGCGAPVTAEKIVWIAGKVTNYPAWELQGVFSTEGLAVEACGQDRQCFIGAVVLDAPLPEITTEWPGAYYPNLFNQSEVVNVRG